MLKRGIEFENRVLGESFHHYFCVSYVAVLKTILNNYIEKCEIFV